MKILWIVNSLLPEIATDCNIKCGNGGGWLSGILNGLNLYHNDLDITISFPFKGEQIKGQIKKIKYISFFENSNYKKDKRTTENIFNIIENENPDIIHIFGTEYSHALAAIECAEKKSRINSTIINIQGLISKCAEHYYADLPFSVIHGCTLRDFLKRDNIIGQRKTFVRRGKFEISAIKKVKNVIGRTDWDEACVKHINGSVNYFFCNETLRKEFYSGQWDYSKCEQYSIFVGSCSYPLKGFHKVVEIMPEILKKYPDAKLYVPGPGPFVQCKFKNLRHKTYYQVYLKKLITRYGLKDKIIFLGNLSAEQIKERMLKSNVYILPSSIENSPNTLGEAMLLGVPCIASDVGGVRNMANDKSEALIYPFEENYMLPFYVEKIFSDIDFANRMSENAKLKAEKTHSVEENRLQLLKIYNKIVTRSE